MVSTVLLLLAIFCSIADAQLSGPVGPLTSFKKKAAKKVCNIVDYGAKSGTNADVTPSLEHAWSDCNEGGLVYIPPGTYAMGTPANFYGGAANAIQLDGTLWRNFTDGDQLLTVQGVKDFELFSGNSKGALQGYGYEFLSKGEYGPRFLRLIDVDRFSLHGIAFVDSASYYISLDTCTNGEVYNIIIRGIEIGATDGIDVWGENMWIHDVEVTNGDECVTVKNPSKHFLIESIYCNLSAGTQIGSLGTGTDISLVHYRHLYMNQANACFLKSNGGNGTVKDITWESVIVHGGPYVLSINQNWGPLNPGSGVHVENFHFKDWHGFNSVNSRSTLLFNCDNDTPCTNMTLDNVNLWTYDGSYVTWTCQSAYGKGGCLKDQGNENSVSSYPWSVTTVTKEPNISIPTMKADHKSPFPSTKPFTIPAVPTSFYPGLKPTHSLLHLNGAGGRGARKIRAAVAAPTETS